MVHETNFIPSRPSVMNQQITTANRNIYERTYKIKLRADIRELVMNNKIYNLLQYFHSPVIVPYEASQYEEQQNST